MLQREWEHSSRPHRRQGKHGHAANTQGARSPACCGESPRAFGQRVSLGDQRLAPEACSEALCGAVCLGAGHLQQHSYAVSTRHGCQLNGAHSPHASFHDVCYEAATTTCIVQMLLGLFMALQLQTSAAGSTSGICCNASGSTHRDRTGGRGSTATQPTHRELAPQHAAGKVPVPLGRECHWETKG